MAHTYNPALGRLIKEDYEFRASLVYMKRTYLKSKHPTSTTPTGCSVNTPGTER